MKVFLGGTVAGSTWRDYVIRRLKIDSFNPVVDTWTEEDQKRELYEREHCEYCLYVLTPKMTGWYSIAEIVEDSYKKTDHTIFCFLKEDGGKKFTNKQIYQIEQIGKLVRANGSIWKKSLDEVIDFLNSSQKIEADKKSEVLNNVFISYGRRHSLAFAKRLHNDFTKQGYDVWFDMNDIPLGVDFQEQIDNGIRKADNFVFIISPHSVKSVYCLKEIVLALKYQKRIIPILHVEPHDCWEKMHHVVAKLNWIYIRQTENFEIPLEEWEYLDDYDAGFDGLIKLIELNKPYTRLHTIILDDALRWAEFQRSTYLLYTGKKRIKAEKWLGIKKFSDKQGNEVQPPCTPTDLHAEFICESIKFSENFMTNAFLSYEKKDIEAKEKIRKSLNKFGISTWSDTTDIKSGTRLKKSIEKGIIEADNFIFLISPESIGSESCLFEIDIAIKHRKRIIPLLIEITDLSDLPPRLQAIRYINFTDRRERVNVTVESSKDVEADVNARKGKTAYEESLDELVTQIKANKEYYYTHKILLARAKLWAELNNPSLLLRGYNLENAKTWLKTGKHENYKPTKHHEKYIAESDAQVAISNPEVFIHYDKNDFDFARKINNELQLAGKITWFDQQNISPTANFEKEIKQGIDESDNLIFILSKSTAKSSLDVIKYANELNKRIIVIDLHKLPKTDVTKSLANRKRVNFINTDFDISCRDLLRVLDIDREYIRKHTKYQMLAVEWQTNNKDESMLLRGHEYVLAESWIKDAIPEFDPLKETENSNLRIKKQPAPTELQIEFVQESKKAIIAAQLAEKEQQEKLLLLEREKLESVKRASKRQKVFMVIISIAFLISVFLSFWAYNKTKEAKQAEKDAKRAKINAEFKEIFALKAKSLAEVAKENAERAQKEAFIEKVKADSARMKAIIEKNKADRALRETEIQRKKADEARALAEKERQKADSARSIAVKAEETTRIAKEIAEQKKEEADSALNVAQKIIDALYFYNEKYALAHKDGKYGYIDKEGNILIEYKYQDAQPFDKKTGLAKVKYENKDYLIDTKGREYLLAGKVTDITDLTEAIDLSGQNLTDIPTEVFENKQIKILLVSKNRLTKITERVGMLSNLIYLNVSSNSLKILPENIKKLKKLRRLIAQDNQLKKVQGEIDNLHELVELNFQNNQLKSLPNGIGKLKKIEKLNLNHNDIKNLPPTISNLSSLLILSLRKNKEINYKEVFVHLGKLKNLMSLDLSESDISNLSPDIGQLQNLKYLFLDKNNLTSLPGEIGNLNELRTLSLNHNNLKSIPEEMQKLENLTELYINANEKLPFTSILNTLGKLKNLEKFYFRYNQLNEIPNEISKINNLTVLDLRNNRLTKIPNSIAKLKKLKKLLLWNNNFTEFPEAILYLTHLNELNLAGNRIKSLPKSIKRLKNLRFLNLDHNILSNLPKEIGDLHKLNKLYIGINKLEKIPKEIGMLNNLTVLYLSGNLLNSLPDELRNLSSLKYINLTHNQFKEKDKKDVYNILPAYKVIF